ncbi:pilus assembly protein PilM [Bremerella cremea]|uniref:Pilus assembly protein PilM n=1 Tax=Blastopirellula marina TaxID=124 RepID=A0A2S8FAT3_9BACT|nr:MULTISPECIES: pilus assembly protein PilM [Pirellulaceae]PQO29276.1 pilus assembly protein PilM [Blastopirellula marina]RCS42581.1 pilus assembly protein PilM [Bremerella cremea]
MAVGKAVWGIDIGQSAVKALKCRMHEDGFWMVAEAFDYIEYPSPLNQAGAGSEGLVKDALREFLSRNDIRNDTVSISVPGQAGLARFFKAPPVEAKRIADIVKYEAKQQIPFPLEDVIWDYQPMPGSHEEEGISLETEIGIFAMKRDQIFRSLQPYLDTGIDVDFVQLSPICLYNFVSNDQLTINPLKEEYDPANQPESYVIVSMGTETTDLVITNGFRVWQRSLPIGGNHFTKQLTKELKLTFAKAEHLKRHASEAENAKLVFQAMRPVFNDLVTEIQRSIGFFQTLDRKAKISRIIPIGNGMKLPGLIPYLGKNLGYDVVELDGYQKLTGTEVTSSPTFRENMLSFATCYGLCLQGLQKSALRTNLLPQEILVDRLVRQKKPWAVAAVAALLAACALNFGFHWRAYNAAHNPEFDKGLSAISTVSTKSSSFTSADTSALSEKENLEMIGRYVVGNEENRRLWPELMKAITTALPVDPDVPPGQVSKKPMDQRPDLEIFTIESQYYPDLSLWYTDAVKQKYAATLENRKAIERRESEGEEASPPIDEKIAAEEAEEAKTAEAADPSEVAEGGEPAVDPADAQLTAAEAEANVELDESEVDPEDELAGPTAEESGWIIELTGRHFHNSKSARDNAGAQYVRNTLIDQLDRGFVELINDNNEPELVSMKELGISHPIIAVDKVPQEIQFPNPDYEPPAGGLSGEGGYDMYSGGGAGMRNPMGTDDEPPVPATIPLKMYVFKVQFCWRETPLSKREEARLAAEQAAAEEAEANAPLTEDAETEN